MIANLSQESQVGTQGFAEWDRVGLVEENRGHPEKEV